MLYRISVTVCMTLALSLWWMAKPAWPEPPPPVPDGGLTHYKQEPCTDSVFGLDGMCFYSLDIKNNRYVAFYVGDLGMVIWRLEDGNLVEIWRRSPDV